MKPDQSEIYKRIITKMTFVTPEMAKDFLATNKDNRNIRSTRVDTYSIDMKKGAWLVTHQGIAFDTDGNLVDGQHRLLGIVQSGHGEWMNVTKGLPVTQVTEAGVELFTSDVLDGGWGRTAGDQMKKKHDVQNANNAAACCSTISHICIKDHRKLSIPTCMSIFELYMKEINYVCGHKSKQPGLGSAMVCGAFSFALKSDPDKVKEFYDLFVSGEGLFRSGPTSSILTLRNVVTASVGKISPGSRFNLAGYVLNAIRFYVSGEELRQIKTTNAGVEFFCARQKASVAKVAAMFNL